MNSMAIGRQGLAWGGIFLLVIAGVLGCAKPADKPAAPAEPAPSASPPETETDKGTDDATGQNSLPSEEVSNGGLVSAHLPQESATLEEATERAEAGAEETVPAETVAADGAASQADEGSEAEPADILGIGDPAPAIAISTWVKGDAVESLAPGQVYVVEFWATWCQPCRASMPHMAELQTGYGDQVQFIGVSDEEVDIVKEFLEEEQSEGKTWNDVVTYRLAMDDNGQTNQRFMAAAEQGGIPTAFIVGRDGVIEWIGHPMAIEEPLKEVVEGTWDREVAIKAEIARKEARRRMRELEGQLAEAVQNQDWEAALTVLDEVAKDQPADSPGLALTRSTFLRNLGKESEAHTVVEDITDKHWENSSMLNAIAWNLAAEMGGVELDLALKMALRADELEGGNNASIQDTVARIYYEKEDLDSAIEWQKKAVEAATGSDGNLKAALEKYEEEKKLREEEASSGDETNSE